MIGEEMMHLVSSSVLLGLKVCIDSTQLSYKVQIIIIISKKKYLFVNENVIRC